MSLVLHRFLLLSSKARWWTLKDHGLQTAIENFGAGDLSADLSRLPRDALKIGCLFVSGMGQSQQDTAIVPADMALAKPLHPKVTGDGAETSAWAVLLGERGCDCSQGYLFEKPLDGQVVGMLLRVAADGEHMRRLVYCETDLSAGPVTGDHRLAAATIH